VKEKTDLGVVLLAGSALLFSLNYLTQCSSAAPRTEPLAVTSPASTRAEERVKQEQEERGRRKSAAEAAAEEDDEERARVQNVGHALQTIGANPGYRETYGIR